MLRKICGMKRQEDLDLASELGVDFCGFIFHEKSPRFVSVAEVTQLESHGMTRVGVFVKQSTDEIIQMMQEARLDFAQLHGDYSEQDALTIGVERVIRVLWPERYQLLESQTNLQKEINRFYSSCTYFLLDAGTSGGGSGCRMNTEFVNGIDFKKPWFLAGGLSVENIKEVLAGMKGMKGINPTGLVGLDINSGIENSPACKNKQKMQKIMILSS